MVFVSQTEGRLWNFCDCIPIWTDDSPNLMVFDSGVPFFGIAAAPLLMLVVFGITSLVCRVPLSVGLARGFRRCAVPVACVLFLIYSGLALKTMQQEEVVNESRNRQMQHMGRYFAELAGEPWPGVAR